MGGHVRVKYTLTFSNCKRRKVEADFKGGDVTGNAGAVLLREIDRRIRLPERVAQSLPDTRRLASCQHRTQDLLQQRVHALALGYEDLNDHDFLRHDRAVQTAVDRDVPLASASTLCRFEQRADPTWMWRIHEVLVEQFMESFESPPQELILDFDATEESGTRGPGGSGV